jgi:hypothetical protein
MRKLLIVTLGFALLAVGVATAGPPEKNAAFERFVGLAGDWVAAEDGEMTKKGDLVARYHLTGSATAVVEDIFPGTPHAMTTVYFLDGSELVLTHYCMTGNQPRMRAKATASPVVAFTFDGGTNINPKKDRHMHNATFEFVGADELKSTWSEYADGKQAMTVKMHLVRKSS